MTLRWQRQDAPVCDPDLHPRHDAFAGWALETGFRDAMLPGRQGLPEAIWLMLELREHGQPAGPPLPQALHRMAAGLPPGWLRLPGSYAQPLRGLEALRFCTALGSPAFIRFLRTGDLSESKTLNQSAEETLRLIRSVILRYEIALQGDGWEPAEPAVETDDNGSASVVVGIIDDGLPFAHERLCWQDPAGIRHTRFLALWNQAADGTPDANWGIGEVLGRARMDLAIAGASDAAARVDEDAAYAQVGLAQLLRHRVTHGAHVADLACGMPLSTQPHRGPAIVGVQLRPMESTLCISAGAHLFDAVRFIIAQADRAGAERVVVNASLGNIAGPHNGSSMFESAIDALVAARRTTTAPVDVVLPEGNSYLSRCHAWSQFDRIDPQVPVEKHAGNVPLKWCLRPDDGTSSYLEIWLRPVGEDKFARPITMTWYLQPPIGPACPLSFTIPSGGPLAAQEQVLRDDVGTLALLGIYPAPANGDLCMGLLAVAPTAAYGPWDYAAPAGAWTLGIEQELGGVALFCNVYSQRDEQSFGHRGRARQAVIEDGFDRVFDEFGQVLVRDGDSFRRRAGTINGLACGSEVDVIGGLVVKPGGALDPANYSSVSLPVDRRLGRRKMAITEDSPVLHGVHAAGCRSGTVAALSGTSSAAPQHARALAFADGGKPRPSLSALDHNEMSRAFVPPTDEQDRRSRLRRGEL